VLAASRDGAAVLAIHAGWRGLAAGVVEQGIAALQARSPAGTRLRAVVGPHIGACCYEVDEPVVVPLRVRFGAGLDAALRPAEAGRPGHWMLDLASLVAVELQRMGISDTDRGVGTASARAVWFITSLRAPGPRRTARETEFLTARGLGSTVVPLFPLSNSATNAKLPHRAAFGSSGRPRNPTAEFRDGSSDFSFNFPVRNSEPESQTERTASSQDAFRL
jgi:hypothetical protein